MSTVMPNTTVYPAIEPNISGYFLNQWLKNQLGGLAAWFGRVGMNNFGNTVAGKTSI